jgi:hypothetical protein
MGVKGKPRRRGRKRKDRKEANVFPSRKAERNELERLGIKLDSLETKLNSSEI